MHLVALRSSIRVATLAAIAILAGCDLWISNDDLCGEGVVRTHYYLDADDDGYGDPSVDGGCAPQDRYVPDARDCDDADATRSPGTAQYPDGDGDGFGVSEGATSGCDLLDGYSFTAGDCDDAAATQADVIAYAFELLGMPVPPAVPFDEAKKEMSAMALSFWQDNRRISNRRIKDELGVRFRYPTYREGLQAIRASA